MASKRQTFPRSKRKHATALGGPLARVDRLTPRPGTQSTSASSLLHLARLLGRQAAREQTMAASPDGGTTSEPARQPGTSQCVGKATGDPSQ
jgi:hypothetical protein